MYSLRGLVRSGMACGFLAALLWGLCPVAADAQSVRGDGVNQYVNASSGAIEFQQISVNAWLDDNGVAHGTVTWEGDVYWVPPTGTGFHGGPADPFLIDVTDIFFVGNTAFVSGVVINSSNKSDIGTFAGFAFTDNSGTGEPDEIDGQPIEAGNISVDD